MNHLPWILRAQGVPDENEGAPEGTLPDGTASGAASTGQPATGRKVIAGVVATVNLVDGTCTTTDGVVIRLGPRTGEVAEAVTRGDRVHIDAEGLDTPEGLIVTEVWIRPD